MVPRLPIIALGLGCLVALASPGVGRAQSVDPGVEPLTEGPEASPPRRMRVTDVVKTAWTGPVSGGEGRPSLRDFLDQWIINGSNIGGAFGAVGGQMLLTRMIPGPFGIVAGSFLGNQVGQLAGELVDNKVNRSFNYVAFSKPALGEPGSVVLEGASPREQLFYQIDRWGISGGGLGSMTAHYGMMLAAHAIPGMRWLSRPVALVVGDYVAGNVGENMDGMMDLSRVGRRLDEQEGWTPERVSVPETRDRRDQAYGSLVEALESGADPASISGSYEAYRGLDPSSARDLIRDP